jgi:glycosyltransferase involved in cell wall biosynthesis
LRISIVTPVLNAAATLPRTIDSVAGQDGVEVEHIVIDGGSSDATTQILAGHNDLRWISEPDRGLSHAANKGIAMATGDVVGWLNADDFYLPGALALVAERMAAEPAAEWLTAPCLIVDDNDQEIRHAVTAYKRWWLRHYSRGRLLVQNFVAAPSTFVRRDALEELGGYDERFRYSMDYDLWLKLAERGAPVIVDEPLAAFRMAEGSLSMTGFERQFAEHAQNAREHGAGHPCAVAANALTSRVIVMIYRLLRWVRARRGAR